MIIHECDLMTQTIIHCHLDMVVISPPVSEIEFRRQVQAFGSF